MLTTLRPEGKQTRLFHPKSRGTNIMKSTKCVECGFVGWSDLEYCKACGAPLNQPRSHSTLPSTDEYDTEKKGLAIFALVLGIVSLCTFGLLGVGAITGIIVACVAISRTKREPSKFGGGGMAIAGLILSIVSLVSAVPVGLAAIAIPNLLAARRAANEGSAIHSLRTISSAQEVYHSTFNKYATLSELGTSSLIDRQLASGTKNGYNFTVELTTGDTNLEGFAAVGVPITYRSTGNRSFYVDETQIIRGSDNFGGPSSKMDQPLDADPGALYRKE
jgi:type IV pilus assembly protein PilA